MSGERDLALLLKDMRPVLRDGVYVFHSSAISFEDAARLDPVLIFKEEEGTALILKKEAAEKAGLSYVYPSRMITLNVHSSLEAVGFLAAISVKLAEGEISVNAVSAHFHDHLFVPIERVERAVALLEGFCDG